MKNTTIVKIVYETPLVIPRDLLDSGITPDELFLLLRVFQLNLDKISYSFTNLSKWLPFGRNKTYELIKSLITKGYVYQEQTRTDKGRFSKTIYYFTLVKGQFTYENQRTKKDNTEDFITDYYAKLKDEFESSQNGSL